MFTSLFYIVNRVVPVNAELTAGWLLLAGFTE